MSRKSAPASRNIAALATIFCVAMPFGGRISTVVTNRPDASARFSSVGGSAEAGSTRSLDTMADRDRTIVVGRPSSIAPRIAAMCSSEVPQHPPMILTPASTNALA